VVRLAQGRVEDARRLAEDAVRTCDALGSYPIPARLCLAEAHAAAGEGASSRAVLAEAHAILLAQAGRVGDPALRRSFLERVPEHARVVEAWRASAGVPSDRVGKKGP
jgi:hypothetical protein